MVNSAFKTCASSIHFNKFAHGYPEKKNLSFKALQSVSSKSAGHIVAFDFASHGFLSFRVRVRVNPNLKKVVPSFICEKN